jgi:hypothetical protein
MHENHAFGNASLNWDHPLVLATEATTNADRAIEWTRLGHERLRASIVNLTDAELSQPRLTNWGEWRETCWIITVMIQHAFYHAEEINHVRSLYAGDDRWAFERGSENT